MGEYCEIAEESKTELYSVPVRWSGRSERIVVLARPRRNGVKHDYYLTEAPFLNFLGGYGYMYDGADRTQVELRRSVFGRFLVLPESNETGMDRKCS